jgi:3-oxoacyl-[acyl-carrier protein] reductase
MTGQLSGRTVIVTGGASGIGRATVERAAAEGANVVIADVDLGGALAVREAVEAAGGKASAHRLDVSSRADWVRVVEETLATWSAIHGLVNNAGVTRDKSLLKMTDDEWELVLDVNLRGVWLGCQHVVPQMKQAGGSIVNLSSESRYGEFGQANYASAKAGVVGLTRTVAIEHARHRIRCNAIAPGTIDTPMVAAVPADIRDSWLPRIPMGRLGGPAEVAAAIVFLLGDDSSYVTGQVLGVDGGSSH